MRHGYSYPIFKREIAQYLKTLAPVGSRALDVGAGEGIYYDLLHDHYYMDAVEAYMPYIQYNSLYSKYKTVFHEDIRDFKFYKNYDLIIMGDIIEHLSVSEARKVIDECKKHCNFIMVAIPYCLKQGPLEGNNFEIHIQDDLTRDIFSQRYPEFSLRYGDNNYGYYVWTK